MAGHLSNDGWDHGYHSRTVYTSDYYREMAPIWLDFAVLLQAHQPPRRQEGEPFRYLELGCGMGFGLCQMAIAYPEGEFVGVDFNPAHVAHARNLAAQLSLNNLQFIDADLLALAAEPAQLGVQPIRQASFHYVASHGVYTWVKQPVRDALVSLASSVLLPGGVFYCSVNTYPGWLGRSLFQKLFWLELGRSDPAEARDCFQRSIMSLHQLLGSAEYPAPLGARHPFLQADLEGLDLNRLDYLNGEYSTAGWQPVYVADLHQHCASHRLTYLTSASLPDCFEQLLAPSLKEVVLRERNPLMRQTLLDLATNKSFRRDLFVKGVDRLSPSEARERRSQLRVVPLQPGLPLPSVDGASAGEQNPYQFNTTFGQVVGDSAVYAPVVAAIGPDGVSVGELMAIAPTAAAELPLILALFLDAGWIALHRGAAGDAAVSAACQANQLLLELMLAGRPYGALASPRAGLSLPFSVVQAVIVRGHQQGLEGELLAGWVAMALDELGIELLDPQHQPWPSPEAARQQLAQQMAECLDQRLPILKRLGAFTAA